MLHCKSFVCMHAPRAQSNWLKIVMMSLPAKCSCLRLLLFVSVLVLHI